MALKDWNKLAEKSHAVTWQSKKRIGNGMNPLLIRVFKRDERWIVAIGLFGGQSQEKKFKTKSLALKYAKSYMKRH